MEKTKTSRLTGVLDGIEKVCDKLPQPAILFMFLFVITALLSFGLSFLNVMVISPATNEEIFVKNFISVDGLYWFLANMITNFTTFPPLGLVLVMTVAVGFCEESGLIEIILNEKMKHTLPVLLPYVVAFVGILGNMASDTALIVIPPLAGLLYLGAGKHPVAGMICGYASVQAGFSANLMIAGTDGLLQSITQEAVDNFLGEGVLAVDITCNWYFMAASTFLCAAVIGFMCNHFVDKRFDIYVPIKGKEIQSTKKATPKEKKAMFYAGISLQLFIIILVCLTIWGPLGIVVGKEAEGTRAFVGSYLLKNLVTILVFAFGIPGIVYGLMTGAFQGITGIFNAMTKNMGKMGGYLTFCFFCAQFQKLFSWTNLDQVLAINGANLLKSTGFTGYGMIIIFILLSSLINIFIPSASAKWAIMAPVFVPMMLIAGNYHPAMTQLFYRIGDSSSNCFTPLMPYIWVALKTAQDMYDPKLKLGKLVSNLLPIAIVLSVIWVIFLIIWMMLGIPIGPGVTTFLET
jgi:aminobenzoyl-glutamate transport protein